MTGDERRRAGAAMEVAMIDAGDGEDEPALHLVERHRRAFRRIEVALAAHVRKGRARQKMDLSHHRADQSLDVRAIIRRAHRSVVDIDAVLDTALLEGRGAELVRIVEMQQLIDAAVGGKFQPQSGWPTFVLHELTYEEQLAAVHAARRAAYPPVGDRLDALFKEAAGDPAPRAAINAAIATVKARYPLPLPLPPPGAE